MGKVVEKVLGAIMKRANNSGKVFYHKEIEAIAKRAGLHVGKIAFLNLSYECSAFCTSVVVKEKQSGLPVHCRVQFSLLTSFFFSTH